MALPSSGPLSIHQIANEFQRSNNLAACYGVAPGIPASGAISILHFYGKSNSFTFDVTASVMRPNIRQMALNAGWNGVQPLIANLRAPLIGTLRITESYPGGLTLNVSAGSFIGGVVSEVRPWESIGSLNPGTAIYTTVPVAIMNYGSIAGAGGFGGRGESTWADYFSTRLYGEGGSGGTGQGFRNFVSTPIIDPPMWRGYDGQSQEYTGVVIGGSDAPWARGGDGGGGGNWGQSGAEGWSGAYGGNYTAAGQWPMEPGGDSGVAVYGNSKVTWINVGDIKGPRIG